MNRTLNERLTQDPFSGLELLTEDAFLSLGSMEAIDWTEPAAKPAGWRAFFPGVALAAALTGLALLVKPLLPESVPLGASVLALLGGILVRNSLPLSAAFTAGCRWIVSRLIPVAIVALGAGLNLGVLAADGLQFLGYILVAVILSTILAVVLGRLFGVRPLTALLIGAGTGICGSSAILAVAPVVDAGEEDILLSVGAINLVGLLAMFACIGVGSLFAITPLEFGILTGTTIHAVPTVAGAAFDHSHEAGEIATLVKLGRVTMLVPFVFAVAALWHRRRHQQDGDAKKTRTKASKFVPWFVWGFAATALVGTLGLIPNLVFPAGDGVFASGLDISVAEFFAKGGKLLLTLAMAAIGLQVGLQAMLRTGGRVIGLAVVVWICVAAAIGGLLFVF